MPIDALDIPHWSTENCRKPWPYITSLTLGGSRTIQAIIKTNCTDAKQMQITICDFGEVYDGLFIPFLMPRLNILEMRFVLVRIAE